MTGQLLPNTEQFKRFNNVRKLSEGGMGEVFCAFDNQQKRPVAIKRVHPHLAVDPDFRKRITREAELHGKLGVHPHIVTMYDSITSGPELFLQMEFVEGESLNEVVRRKSKADEPVPATVGLTMVSHILRALSLVHSTGTIHRDIKSNNVMVTEVRGIGMTGKLLDFGIAKAYEQKTDNTGLTREGTSPGTCLYMAPEQFSPTNFGEPTYITDIYSCGIVLFECLAGKLPFNSNHQFELMDAHIKNPLPGISRKSLTDEEFAPVRAILEKACAKKMCDRYQSAEEMDRAILEVLPAIQAAERMHYGVDPLTLVSVTTRNVFPEMTASHKGVAGPSISDSETEALSVVPGSVFTPAHDAGEGMVGATTPAPPSSGSEASNATVMAPSTGGNAIQHDVVSDTGARRPTQVDNPQLGRPANRMIVPVLIACLLAVTAMGAGVGIVMMVNGSGPGGSSEDKPGNQLISDIDDNDISNGGGRNKDERQVQEIPGVSPEDPVFLEAQLVPGVGTHEGGAGSLLGNNPNIYVGNPLGAPSGSSSNLAAQLSNEYDLKARSHNAGAVEGATGPPAVAAQNPLPAQAANPVPSVTAINPPAVTAPGAAGTGTSTGVPSFGWRNDPNNRGRGGAYVAPPGTSTNRGLGTTGRTGSGHYHNGTGGTTTRYIDARGATNQ